MQTRAKGRPYQIACALLISSAMSVAHAQVFTSLVSLDFNNDAPEFVTLVQGFNGNLYGMSSVGGGDGSVFRVTTSGTIQRLHEFTLFDGKSPLAGLTLGRDGNLYGTTTTGGTGGGGYFGVIFKITPLGTFTLLHSFNFSDGDYPASAPVQGRDATFYGTTQTGGASNVGTIFKIDAAGVLTNPYVFAGSDGGYPGPLLLGRDGNFYGTTSLGGINSAGTFFRMTPQGVLTTLYNFCALPNCTDGYGGSPLLQASNGNFYGVSTVSGSDGKGQGLIYKLTPTGTLSVLHRFCMLGNCADGSYPLAGLVQATDGNLYSAANQGGLGSGVIYSITLGGTYTVLHEFLGSDGAFPSGGLVQATDGKLYGTTNGGGTDSDGTVFGLDMGLGPFVKTVTGYGRVGSKITILGTNLTGATDVSFNGTAASFTVVSATQITTTVPTGATTGTVTVTTPGGTLSSNIAFRVLP